MVFYEVNANGCQDKKCILHEFLTIQVVHDKIRQVGKTGDSASQENRLTMVKQRIMSPLYYMKRA